MSSLSTAARRHRACLLASTVFIPAVLTLHFAGAMHSNPRHRIFYLPSPSTCLPRRCKRLQPAAHEKARAGLPRPGCRSLLKQPTRRAGNAADNSANAARRQSDRHCRRRSTRSPSSVSVITSKDIETQQYRTVPEALELPCRVLTSFRPEVPAGRPPSSFAAPTPTRPRCSSTASMSAIPAPPMGIRFRPSLDRRHCPARSSARPSEPDFTVRTAIGGVISIITQKGDGPPRATASIEAGSFGTFNQSVGISGSQNNFNYAASITHLHVSDMPVTPFQFLPPGRQANGNNYDNMTYSTKTGVDLNEFWTVNSVARYTEGTCCFTGDTSALFRASPHAQQSTHEVRQLFTREEAILSLLDGRIKNYFGVNYTNNWCSDIAPGDPTATVTTGDRLKYDWRSCDRRLPTGQNLVVGAEQQTETMNTTGLSAKNRQQCGVRRIAEPVSRIVFFLVCQHPRGRFQRQLR